MSSIELFPTNWATVGGHRHVQGPLHDAHLPAAAEPALVALHARVSTPYPGETYDLFSVCDSYC